MLGAKTRIGWAEAMLGSSGGVVSQAEILAELFRSEGHEVRVTSRHPKWPARLADTIWSTGRWRGDVDVLVTSAFSGRGFAMAHVASFMANRIGVPAVVCLRGGNLPTWAPEHERWVRRVLDDAAAIVAPSTFLAQTFEGLGYEVSIIPNVVRLERYEYRHRDRVAPRLLWMRKFNDIYAPELAVDVLASVRARFPETILTMAGPDWGHQATVQQRAEELGVADALRLPGFLGPEAKQAAFASHDVFLNTNRVDNMPVGVLEAAAAGLPVVATRAGGVPHLLEDEVTALLVDIDDAAAMAHGVIRLLEDDGLAASLSAAGRELATRCDWPAVRPQWERVFADVTQG